MRLAAVACVAAAQADCSMNAADFPLHFLRVWWWLALAPLPWALWVLARDRGGRAALARLADAALLPHLVRDGGTRQRLALGLVAVAWVLGVAALAGPAWQKIATPLYVNGAARVVALSLSDDMLAQDLQPDRMTRARFAVRDLLDAAGDARTALVAYAGAAFTVAPLTDDKRTVLNLLDALKPDVMPVPGNDAAAGIQRSVALLRQSQVQGGEIVLVTDTADAAAVAAARAAHARGIREDVLGVGTTQGAPIPRSGGGFASAAGGVQLARRDDAALRAVAAAGGGRYAVLQADGVGAVFAAPAAAAGHASNAARAQVWRDGGIWLLPLLLVLAALGFRRGWLLVAALLVLPLGVPVAHAGTLDAWFANRDQRALQALRHGDAARAQKLAATPGVRGAADYRAGDYAGAAKAFAQGHDARSRYNLGNALAKQDKYQSALAAYQQALQREPGMADARANLDAVEAWLKQHPQSSPQQGQGQQNGHPRNGAPASGASGGDASNTEKQAGKSATAPTPKTATDAPNRASGANQDGGAQQQPGRAGAAPTEHGAPAASAVARQREQEQAAARGLDRMLQHAPSGKAFALGQTEPQHEEPFNAQQRALLQSVPDDPGALLRRKFQLEWEQRNGAQQQEDGQP
jgi:Ca-activated chloride channel family protein